MNDMRKITVDVDGRSLEAARAEGAGVAETVREAIRDLAHKRACQKLLALEGKVQFELSWEELRGKNDD
jgi:post-segregation antitoxin (ccd killing protein)